MVHLLRGFPSNVARMWSDQAIWSLRGSCLHLYQMWNLSFSVLKHLFDTREMFNAKPINKITMIGFQ